MRPPKALSVLALTVLLFQTTGCWSWTPVQSELPTRLVPSGSDQAVKIRVETTDGARLELAQGWMSSDSVGGMSALRTGKVSRSFPLTQVQTVKRSEFHPYRTTFIGLGVVATLWGVLAIAISQAISQTGIY
jgi:hypothetical protein